MTYGNVAVLLTFLLGQTIGKLDQYCSLCSEHTLCKYQSYGPACADLGEGGVSEAEKRDIVDIHNWYRSIVAGGYENRGLSGKQPSAANMMKLTWDDELAMVAQRWADQCEFRHDTCRDVPRWKVGQNLYWSKIEPVTNVVNWTQAIQSWYEEVEKFNPRDVSHYRFEPATGHYTQLVWHNTVKIGCGRRNYGPNKIYACNYGPTGNWIGEPMYAVGAPCTQCPSGSSCSEGLCDSGTIVPVPEPPQLDPVYHGNAVVQGNSPSPYLSYNLVQKPNEIPVQKNKLLHDHSNSELTEEVVTTEPSNNSIDSEELDIIRNDEEIKMDIQELKLRILDIARKILEKRLRNMEKKTSLTDENLAEKVLLSSLEYSRR